MKKNKGNIAIITGFPFPYGYSGTNRIISYSRGFVEEGVDVCVFLYKRISKVFNKNIENSGVYQGIKFLYPSKNIFKSDNKIIFLFQLVLDVFFSAINICKYNKCKTIDVALIATDDPIYVLFFSFFLKFIGVKQIVLVVDEYPIPIRYGKDKISIFRKFCYRVSFHFITSMISMTSFVRDYYKAIIKRDILCLLVPITVENDRFNINVVSKKNYITYIGNLEIQKDGVDILIRSFALIVDEFSNFKLRLVGDGPDKSILLSLVKDLQIEHLVDFVGIIDREQVPFVMKESKILCLSRQYSKRAEGGFPTKVGEYLSSGVPVILTSVGEIPLYLKDKDSAYIVTPNSIVDFADAMIYVLKNYDEAQKVGLTGRVVANTVFNYKYQSKRILNFLNLI